MSSVFKHVIKPVYLRARYVRSRLTDRRLGIMTTDECVALESGQDFSSYDSIPGGVHRAESGQDFSSYDSIPGGVHRAVSFTGIRRLMRCLNPGPNDALLDYGCGAGRVICVAAQYPFSRIIGIEIDGKVWALAERNARTLRRFSVHPEVVRADAATYRVPDDITVVFLYNSFGGEVLRSALTRVLESHDRAPRHMRLVYANPREHDLVASMERFRETGRLRMSWRPGAEWARTQMMRFYEVEARK